MIVGIKVEVDAAGGIQSLNAVGGGLTRMGSSADAARLRLDGVAGSANRTGGAVELLSARLARAESLSGRVGSGMQSLGTRLAAAITVPIVALATMAGAASTSYETAFANVAKTVEATQPQLEALRTDLLELSTVVPIDAKQLASIAALGGQLGVATSDIRSFTETIAALGVAVDGMSTEEAATQLAQFGNVMQSSDWNTMAATLVDLGNKGSSSEAAILGLATRMAGAGKELGLTIPTVMGFSAALANVGVEAERGGTAAQRLLLSLREAVRGGDVGVFAKIAGQSFADFRALAERDMNAATRAVVEGLGTAKARGIDVVAALKDVGIEGELAKLTFLQLAGSGGKVADAFRDADAAARAGNAHWEEARKKFDTTANQLLLLQNQLFRVAVIIGDALMPHVRNLTAWVSERLVPWIKRMADTWSALPSGVQLATLALVGVVAAAPLVVLAMGTIATSVSQVIALYQTLRGLQLASAVGSLARGAALGAAVAAAPAAPALPAAANVASAAYQGVYSAASSTGTLALNAPAFGGVTAAAANATMGLRTYTQTVSSATGTTTGFTAAIAPASQALTGVGTAAGATAGSVSAVAPAVTGVTAATVALYTAAIVAGTAIGTELGGALLKSGDALRGLNDPVRASINDAGLFTLAWGLAGDAIKSVESSAASLPGPLGLAAQGVVLAAKAVVLPIGLLWDALAFGASKASDGIEFVAHNLGQLGPETAASASEVKLFADASAIAHRTVTDFGEAVRIVHGNLKGIPPEIAANAVALQAYTGMLAANQVLLDGLKKGAKEGAATAALGDAQLRTMLKAKEETALLDKASKALGQTVTDVATAQRVLTLASESGAGGMRKAKEATREHDAALNALGLTSGKSARELAEVERTIVSLGGAANLSRQSILAVGEDLQKAAQNGTALGAESQKALDRFLDLKIAEAAAKSQADAMAQLRAEAERVAGAYQALSVKTLEWSRTGAAAGIGVSASMQLVERSVTGASAVLPRLMQILAGVGAAGGFDKMAPDVLEQVIRDLEDLAVKGKAAGGEIRGVVAALNAARAAQGAAHQGSLGEVADAWNKILAQRQQAEAERVAQMWRDALSFNGVLQAGTTLLGLLGNGWEQVASGIDEASRGAEQFVNATDLSGVIQGLASVWSGFKKATDSASTFQRAVGGAMVGAKLGGQIGGAIGGPMGQALGAGVGGAIGLVAGIFHKPSWARVGEEAGRILGDRVSKELAKRIEATSKDLKVSVKVATLLNLDQAIQESGRSVGSYASQIGALFGGIRSGSIPAAEGIAQLGSVFGLATQEAERLGKSYTATTVAMLTTARKAGIETREMAEVMRAGLEKAAGAFEGLIGKFTEDKGAGGTYLSGLLFGGSFDATNAEMARGAEAQARLYVATFWAVAEREGIVGAVDALRAPFERFRENLTTALGPAQIAALLGPIERYMALVGDKADESADKQGSLFRGAAEAAAATKDIVDGLAQSSYMSADALSAAGVAAQDAFRQAYEASLSTGVDQATAQADALRVVQPLLQSLLDAGDAYNLTLDEGTQGLIGMAEASGLAFKTDPQTAMVDLMQTQVDLMKAMVTALGGDIPASAQRAATAYGDAFNALEGGSAGARAAIADIGSAEIPTDNVISYARFAEDAAIAAAGSVAGAFAEVGKTPIPADNVAAWAEVAGNAVAGLGSAPIPADSASSFSQMLMDAVAKGVDVAQADLTLLGHTAIGTDTQFDPILGGLDALVLRAFHARQLLDSLGAPGGAGTGGPGALTPPGQPDLPGYDTGTVSTRPHVAIIHGSPGNPELVAPVRAQVSQMSAQVAGAVVDAMGGAGRDEGGRQPLVCNFYVDGAKDPRATAQAILEVLRNDTLNVGTELDARARRAARR